MQQHPIQRSSWMMMEKWTLREIQTLMMVHLRRMNLLWWCHRLQRPWHCYFSYYHPCIDYLRFCVVAKPPLYAVGCCWRRIGRWKSWWLYCLHALLYQGYFKTPLGATLCPKIYPLTHHSSFRVYLTILLCVMRVISLFSRSEMRWILIVSMIA